MDVRPLNGRAARVHPAMAQLGALVSSLGTEEFEPTLFAALNAVAGCDHVSVFVVPEGSRPRVLLASSKDGTSVAWKAGREYATNFWHLDPSNSSELLRDRSGVMVRSTPADVRAAGYRRQCYSQDDWARTGSQIIERLALMFVDAHESYKVSLFRQAGSGPFAQAEIDAVAAWSAPLLALLKKHDRLSATSQGDFEKYVGMLALVAPGLSPREREVCAGIAFGMSSEAIRLKLGVSLSTVQTHRKRAYARLRISSQNELLKLLFRGSTH
jgi:DNA-binding CsgD family transcriptional regulator